MNDKWLPILVENTSLTFTTVNGIFYITRCNGRSLRQGGGNRDAIPRCVPGHGASLFFPVSKPFLEEWSANGDPQIFLRQSESLRFPHQKRIFSVRGLQTLGSAAIPVFDLLPEDAENPGARLDKIKNGVMLVPKDTPSVCGMKRIRAS